LVELGLPRNAVVVSIQHGKETLIPRGDSLITAGDVLTFLCERSSIPEIKSLLAVKKPG
jgi:voltage-gated potassium channel